MITIIHGENTVKSRDRLVELITDKKERGIEIERLEAIHLERGDLETTLIAKDLFGTERVVVIEKLHSLPRSKRKNQLIELVAKKTGTDVILWEQRDLTKTMLKKFPDAHVDHFKLSNALFTWLDTFRGDNRNIQQQVASLHTALEEEDAYLCFIMLARQIRLMLQVTTGGRPPGPPWLINKIKKQAATFSEEQLFDLHQRLVEIDYAHKTSTNNLELIQELDLLLLNG